MKWVDMNDNQREAALTRAREIVAGREIKSIRNWTGIAKACGVTSSPDPIRRRLDPAWARAKDEREHRRTRPLNNQFRVEPRVPHPDVAARLAEIPERDTRSLTGRLFGDPHFERSALYKREVGQP